MGVRAGNDHGWGGWRNSASGGAIHSSSNGDAYADTHATRNAGNGNDNEVGREPDRFLERRERSYEVIT